MLTTQELSFSTNNSVDASAIREQLQKILAHPLFVRSERMAKFLAFTVEQVLQGKGADLKEYLIGMEVFDRREDYDTRVDPIVRVEARRLRSKLQAYYDQGGYNNAGRASPILIELPVGSYAPRIRLRHETHVTHPPSPRTIAVLPLTNLSGSTEHDYFTDGLTEELIHTLTRMSAVRVVAWTSATQLRGTEQNLSALRKRLQVTHILTGSVRIVDATLRVRSQLIDTETGIYLWSETFDRQMHEVLAIQEDIARAIVRTLRVQLAGGVVPDILPRSATNLSSYDYYLKGRYHWHRRTPHDLSLSARYFEAAVEADPHSVLAHSGLADAYTLLVDYGVLHPVEGIPKAKSAAMRAIELDETMADPYPALALISSHCDGQWEEAEHLYRKALSLNPGCATAHHRLAIVYYALLGRFLEAELELEAAILRDPLSNILYEGRAVLCMLQRRYDEALQGYRTILDVDPSYSRAYTGMGRVYALMRRFGEAVTMLEKGRTLGGETPYILSALGQVLGLSGDHAGAHSMLAKLEARARTEYVPSTCFAIAHLGLGETDRALDWLDEGCRQHEMRLAILNVHPAYDDLRGHPRFQAVLERLGFPVAHAPPDHCLS